MKKLFAVILSLTVTAGMTACSPARPAATSGSTPSQPVPESRQPESPSSQSESDTEVYERLYVADAAVYRGTVTSLAPGSDGGWVMVLEQAPGTNFGAPSLTFVTDENTRYSFPASKLDESIVGVYLEVFYGIAPGQPLDASAQQKAIGINDYMTADMVNFNGVVMEVSSFDDKPGEGQILTHELGDENNVVAFNYSGETQFYLDFDSIAPGDKLNFFHSPAMTRSLPPQTFALEVRKYYSAQDK